MFQYVYVWYHRELSACKIGKTNSEIRLHQRMLDAVSSNPGIEFIGAWQTTIGSDEKDPRTGKRVDAGKIASDGLSNVKFESGRGGAKEWFAISPEEAFQTLSEKYRKPVYTKIPEKILNGKPYDHLGASPKTGNMCVNRLWVHQENSPRSLLKLSDNSWWKSNFKSTWFKAFNPFDVNAISVFEVQDIEKLTQNWSSISLKMRQMKHELQEEYGVKGLPPCAKCGWFDLSVVQLKDLLFAKGLVEKSMGDQRPAGVLGQGDEKD